MFWFPRSVPLPPPLFNFRSLRSLFSLTLFLRRHYLLRSGTLSFLTGGNTSVTVEIVRLSKMEGRKKIPPWPWLCIHSYEVNQANTLSFSLCYCNCFHQPLLSLSLYKLVFVAAAVLAWVVVEIWTWETEDRNEENPWETNCPVMEANSWTSLTSSLVIPNIVNAEVLVDDIDSSPSTPASATSTSIFEASAVAVGVLTELTSTGVELVLVEEAVSINCWEKGNKILDWSMVDWLIEWANS